MVEVGGGARNVNRILLTDPYASCGIVVLYIKIYFRSVGHSSVRRKISRQD